MILDRLLSNLIGCGLIFAILWCVFANFDIFATKDTLTVYRLSETTDRVGSRGQELPSMIADGKKEYRIVNDKVTVKYPTGDVSDYENCTIFDVENWSCTFSDRSATFGAKSGKFFEHINTSKFPHLATYGKEITVSRFQHMVNSCEWALTGNKFWGILECAVYPFLR